MSRLHDFFRRYEASANRLDPDQACALYTAEFLGGDPTGVAVGRNDDSLREAMVQRKALFEQIGFRQARVLEIEETVLDAHYTLAKVHWLMVFEKIPGQPQEFRFAITYGVHDDGKALKVAFWISHEDERQVMQQAGLI